MKKLIFFTLACLMFVDIAFGAECEDNGGRCRIEASCSCFGGSYTNLACDDANKRCCEKDDTNYDGWIACPLCENEGGICRDDSNCECFNGGYTDDYSCGAWNPGTRCCMPNDSNQNLETWVACSWQFINCEEDMGGVCREQANCECSDGAYNADYKCYQENTVCCLRNDDVVEADWMPCAWQERTCENNGGRCRERSKCDCLGGDFNAEYSCGPGEPEKECCMADAGTDLENWVSCQWEYPTCEEIGGRCRDPTNCPCIDGQFDNNYPCGLVNEQCCVANDGVDPETWISCEWERRTCENAGGRCRETAKCDCFGGSYDSNYSCLPGETAMECCMPAAAAATDPDNWYACEWEKPECEELGGRCRDPNNCDCLDGTFSDGSDSRCYKDNEVCCLPNDGVDTSNWISCPWELRTCENNGGRCRRRENCECFGGNFNDEYSCDPGEPEMDCCMPNRGTRNDPAAWFSCSWEITGNDCGEANGVCQVPRLYDCEGSGGNWDLSKYCSRRRKDCCVLPED